ncbi:DUF6722 family protein [Bacteroides fragilis]
MKKEFGKWLMDVAKYMTTALLLSSAFGDMENPWVITSVIIASAATLGAGLWLVRNKEKKGELIMGAIAVSIFVTVVAVVGVIYFNRQDRKEMHQTSK